ncbi:MAG: DUF4350 domain-containing protein [Candidatus Binatia bacterium]
MRRALALVVVQALAVLGILVCLLLLVARHPLRLDLTPDRHFTLSPHSREVLGRLLDDVRVTVFFNTQEGALTREMSDLLGLYRDASPRVSVRFLDLDRSPGAAQQLGVSSYNVAIVESGARRERVESVTEDEVTTALLRVAGTPPVVTTFVLGHGEHDPRDADARGGAAEAARALVADGFVVRAFEGAAALPPDAGLVVLAGPRRDLAPGEVDAIARHLEAGGHALVLADPGSPPSVAALVRRFGVELAEDVVVDDQGRLFGTDGLSARVAYLNQTLVPVAPEASGLLPIAQTLRLAAADDRHDYLAMTGEATWADVDRRVLDHTDAGFRQGQDRRGPLPVGVLVRVPAASGIEGRLAVLGDSDFMTNLHLGLLGNRDLLLTVAELVGRTDPMTASRPATPPAGTFSPLALTAGEGRLLFWGAVVIPSALFALAAAVMAHRQRHG